jgi:hypothetical protein
MRRVWLILAACVLVAVGASVSVTAGWWESGADVPRSAFVDRARLVLDGWRRAAASSDYDQRLRLLNRPLLRPTNGFPDDQAESKFSKGSYTSTLLLSQQIPPAGLVRFGNGATLPVPLLPANDAYFRIGQDHVENCSPGYCLRVTNTRLDTVSIRTNYGLATVPAWLFTIDGWSDPVGWIAIDQSTLAPLPQVKAPDAPADPAIGRTGGVVGWPATDGGTDATRLTIWLGEGECGIGYAYGEPQPVVYEAPDAVVVGGLRTRHRHNGPCPGMPAISRPYTITLATPLGARILLDGATGQPIPLG